MFQLPFKPELQYALKRYKIENDLTFFQKQPKQNIRKPIVSKTIARRDFPNSPETKKKFAKYNYKYVSRVVVSGSDTPLFLRNLKKCVGLKVIKKFEFDPFLSESSSLKPLSKVLSKLKYTAELNLIIRRVDRKNEFGILCPHLYRINRLNKLRVEFPGTAHIDSKCANKFQSSLQKCSSIKSAGIHYVYMPDLGQPTFVSTVRSLHRLKQLTHLQLSTQGNYSANNEFVDEYPLTFPRLPKLQELQYKMGMKTGWSAKTCGYSGFLPNYIGTFHKAFSPKRFSYKFDRYVLTTEAVVSLSSLLPKLNETREVALEFLSCDLGELEIDVLADGLANCTQIEQLSFKVIQKFADAFTDSICKFAECIANLSNLKKFNIYFRNLKFNDYERTDVWNILSKLKVYFNLTKTSLHVSSHPTGESVLEIYDDHQFH